MNDSRELVPRAREIDDLTMGVRHNAPAMPSAYKGVENENEQDMHLLDYWRTIRKRLWLVIGIMVLMTTLAAIYMARKPDIYQANARLQVDLENANPSPLGASRAGSVIINSRVNDPAYFNTQLQILTSPGLLRRVVKTLDLEHNRDFLKMQSGQNVSTWQSMRRMLGLSEKEKPQEKNITLNDDVPLTTTVAPATAREDLIEAKRLAPYVYMLQIYLKVDPVKETRLAVKETRLIDIRYDHPDPEIAAKVINAIADTYTLSNLEKKNETSDATKDYLNQRIAELQSQIRTGGEQLVNFAKNHQILSLTGQQDTVVARLAGLNQQLLEVENKRKEAEAKYKMSLVPGAMEARTEESAKQIAEIENVLINLRQKRAQLLVDNTEEWPEVKEVTAQIATLEKQITNTRSRATVVAKTNLESDYRQALDQEAALRKAYNEQRGETMTQNEAAVNYHIIEQEIATNKTLLDGLLQKSKENDVVVAGTPNNVHIIDYALIPEYPIGPNRLRIVILAMAVSLGMGIGFAFFLDYLDDTVRSTDDVEKMLRLPALGVIPAVDESPRRKLLGGIGGTQGRNGKGGNPELIVNADSRSSMAEAYRQLRTSVLLTTAGRAPKSLLVTSSQPSEGKTTTATNMAISLAQTGASVLIIDADMRRPRLHGIFEVENRRGLSSYLSSQMSEAELLDMIELHEASGLHVMTSGPVPPNPAELLGSDQMRKLMQTLEATFTHVVIDSPPIASFTDGVLIATMVDGVLLVVHGGKSSRHVVRRAKQVLQDVGAKVFGVVLNNVNLHSHDYYYYSRYYHQSYYAAEQADGEKLASGTQG